MCLYRRPVIITYIFSKHQTFQKITTIFEKPAYCDIWLIVIIDKMIRQMVLTFKCTGQIIVWKFPKINLNAREIMQIYFAIVSAATDRTNSAWMRLFYCKYWTIHHSFIHSCRCDWTFCDLASNHSRVWSGAKWCAGCSYSLLHKIKCIYLME